MRRVPDRAREAPGKPFEIGENPVAALVPETGKGSGDDIGITVNTVTPGLITTDMTTAIPDKVMEKLTSQIPVGRAGRPAEIGRLVAMLFTSHISYLTGETIYVDGGLGMNQ